MGEVATPLDGELLLETVQSCYPGTRTLAYWESTVGMRRALRIHRVGNILMSALIPNSDEPLCKITAFFSSKVCELFCRNRIRLFVFTKIHQK